MQARGVELVGPLPDMASMVSKQAQQRGVGEAYRKEAFTYDAQNDSAKITYAPVDTSLVVPRARTYGKKEAAKPAAGRATAPAATASAV